jgi:NCS2 family nucleobase:cation symporter-2
VGIALIFGLSVEMVPGLYHQVPNALAPLFSSALSLTTVLVVGLNLLFRIGVAKYRTAEFLPNAFGNFEEIRQLLQQQGAVWGMRTEVVVRATDAIHEFMIAVQQRGVKTPVRLELCFDEFNLEADLRYQGEPIELPTAPPSKEVLDSSPGSATVSIAAYLVCQFADQVTVRSERGHCHVHLHFEH